MINVNFPDAGGNEALPRAPVNPPLPQPTAPTVGFESDLPEPPSPERREPAPVQRRGPNPKDLEMLNKLMDGLGHRLEFGLFPATDEFFVKVVDRSSNRVVKVIPQEELLRLSQKLTESLGLFLDRNV